MKKILATLAIIVTAGLGLTGCASSIIHRGTVDKIFVAKDANTTLVIDIKDEGGKITTWQCQPTTCGTLRLGDQIVFEDQGFLYPDWIKNPRVLSTSATPPPR